MAMLNERRDQIMEFLPAMRGFAFSLTSDPFLAEDVLQEAVIRAWTNFEKYESGTNLKAWLLKIVRNTFYSQLRRPGRETVEVVEDGPMAAAVGPSHDGVLQLRDFRRALRKLGFEHREALLLVGAFGFSYAEVAEMCDVPLGTIKSRVLRARRQLSEELERVSPGGVELTDPMTRAVLSRNPPAIG
jgi:RNA polymerase sigma-70 factor (ECF subfamily)